MYLLVGAGLTLASQLLIQLVIVPRVETRKRREDRWERDVLALGELLTAEIPGRASSAYISQSVLQHYYHQVMPLKQATGGDAATLEHLKDEARATVQSFRDMTTRINWLMKRITSIAPGSPQVNDFDGRVAMHRATATLCTFYNDGRSDDFDEDKYAEIWSRENKYRTQLAEYIAVILQGRPPRNGPIRSRIWVRFRRLGKRIHKIWSG